MTLSEKLIQNNDFFIDTAPIIYYIEANPKFGPLVKKVIDIIQTDRVKAFSSVITLTEVLAKPVQMGEDKLANRFAEFLKDNNYINLIEISTNIAEKAGYLRGKYIYLRTIDSIQISASLEWNIKIFLTNDKNLKQVKEIEVLVLNDYL